MWLLALPPLVPLLLVAQLTGVKVTSTRQRANSRWGLPCVRIALFPVTRAHRPDPEQENSLDVIVSAFFPWRCLQTDATDLDGSMEHDNQYLKYHVAFLSSGFIPFPPPPAAVDGNDSIVQSSAPETKIRTGSTTRNNNNKIWPNAIFRRFHVSTRRHDNNLPALAF